MKRAVLLALAATALPFSAVAQSSSTPVIGYYKQSFPQAGVYSLSVGFVTKKDFQGLSTATPSIAGGLMTIQQSGAAWAVNQFNTSATPATQSSHYVEILNDGNAQHTGMILDITSNSASSIVVEVPAGFTVSSAVTYAVRKHVTLGSLLGAGSGVVPSEDLVVMLDSAGNEVTALYQGGASWADAINPSINLSNYPLYPGQGFLFLPSDTRTITIGGGEISYVKEGPTRISMTSGVPTLVGLINPLVATNPADPIYSTTAVNTLTNFGLTGMVPASDLAVLLVQDGSLETIHNVVYDIGPPAHLLDAIDSTVLDTVTLRNGYSILYIPGGDVSFSLPQRH